VYVLLALALACGSDTVRRTQLDRWRTKQFAADGISIQAPADAFTSFGIQMHHRANGIADATWFVQITIDRRSRASFEAPQMPSPENPVASDASYMAWLRWVTTYHPELSVYESGSDSVQYRRDVDLGGGDVASIHATYVHWPFTWQERADDDAAIRRIVLSARPRR